MGASEKDQDLVQILNPKTNRYVLVDRLKGEILEHREEPGPYRDVPVAEWRKIKDPAQPPDSFTKEEAREAARAVSAKRLHSSGKDTALKVLYEKQISGAKVLRAKEN